MDFPSGTLKLTRRQKNKTKGKVEVKIYTDLLYLKSERHTHIHTQGHLDQPPSQKENKFEGRKIK